MPTPPPTAAAAAAATAASSSRQALSSKRLRSDATNDTSSGPHTTLPLATVRDLASAGINTNAIPRDNDLSNSDVVNMMTAWLFFDEPVVDNAGGSQPRMLASPNAGEASLRASAQKGVESRTSQLQRNSQNSPSPRISTNTATTSASSNTNTGSSRPEACVREKAPHRTDDMNPAVAALASATRVPTLPLQPRRRPLFHAGTWHNDSEEDVVDAAAAATAARPFSKALGPAASATTGAAAQSPVSDAAGGETSRVAEADDSDEYDYEDGEEDLLEGFYPEEYGQCAPRQSPNSIVFILTAEDSFSSSDNGLTDSKGAMRARGKDLWAPRKPRVLRRSTPLPLTPHNNKPVQCRYTSSPRLQDNALQSIEGPHEQPQLQLVRGRSSATVDSARQLELLRIYRPTSSKYAPDPSKMQRPVGNTFGLRRHRRANNADAAALVYGGAGAAAAAGKAGDAECDDDDDEEWEEDEEWVWEEVEVEECSDDDDDDGDGAEGEGDVSQSLEY
ncbi:hypothetical protein DQ04_10841010 [Trypanosoma grayi]|uniref:hypothetical protein n=1 Tax=Trypanosoma grayi TaxID=71804 RepID=UPI0004F4A27C|nr:hypothetical protein DQ04_10841010 [Trypanosoma grayi]KEG07115.1 hypothetical protein DQ04_10841010 [Trypanosoma grayi]